MGRFSAASPGVVRRRPPARTGFLLLLQIHSSGPRPLVRCDQGPLPQLRPPGIVVAAGVLAAIAEEVTLAGQDLETRCLSGSAEYGRLAGEPASRHEAKGLWQDDLHLAYGLGRAAD